MFCSNCGHRNPTSANFCSSCGNALVGGQDNPATITFSPVESAGETEEEFDVTVDRLQEGEGLLVVRRGPNAGRKYPLSGAVTRVGRHPQSDIFLDDITVSRRHAEFVREGGSYRVRDVGSLNGTYLNRERIEEAAVAHGDEVQVGKFKLVFLEAVET